MLLLGGNSIKGTLHVTHQDAFVTDVSHHAPFILFFRQDMSSCLDSFRAAIATHVSKALNIPFETALDGVDYGKKGVDFTVAVPRFRLAEKPPVLIQKIVAGVCNFDVTRLFLTECLVRARRAHRIGQRRRRLCTFPVSHSEPYPKLSAPDMGALSAVF